MSLDPRLVDYEGNIGEFAHLEHLQHVFVEVGLRHLNADVKHPDVVEGQLAIVATEYVKLPLDNVRCVPASRSRPVVTRLNFLPMILFDVKDMDVVHPMRAIVAAEVVNFRVHEAARRGNSRGRLLAGDDWLHPGQRACV